MNESIRIRVLVVDDHPMVRNGLAHMIKGRSELEWVGEAANGRDAVARCIELRPDVVLMDALMPEMDGATAIGQIHASTPDVYVLMLSSFHDPRLVKNAMRAGATGYVLKTASADEVTSAIVAAAKGRRTLAPEATNALVEAEQSDRVGRDLSKRERQVLECMSEGLSNAEIAIRLSISLPTVKFHITNILSKLHVDSRTEAVLIAIKHGIVILGN